MIEARTYTEIERKFLLRCSPAMPRAIELWRIEQGYLAPDAQDSAANEDSMQTGRLRRITYTDNSVRCFHTIKTGVGRTRTETEREIPIELFESHWPRTVGRRLRKLRHRIRDQNLVWEVDVFDGFELVLAEVELPHADFEIAFPQWLAPYIIREVTDEPSFTNASIAARTG